MNITLLLVIAMGAAITIPIVLLGCNYLLYIATKTITIAHLTAKQQFNLRNEQNG